MSAAGNGRIDRAPTSQWIAKQVVIFVYMSLINMNLWTLEERRNRQDRVEVFLKIYKGISLMFSLYAGTRAERSWVRVPALPLFYWVATLDKLFTHIASPVFSAPRNWDTKGSIRTGPV